MKFVQSLQFSVSSEERQFQNSAVLTKGHLSGENCGTLIGCTAAMFSVLVFGIDLRELSTMLHHQGARTAVNQEPS